MWKPGGGVRGLLVVRTRGRVLGTVLFEGQLPVTLALLAPFVPLSATPMVPFTVVVTKGTPVVVGRCET